MSFGQHLGAEQNNGFTFLNLVIDFLPTTDPTGRVTINPNYVKVGEQCL